MAEITLIPKPRYAVTVHRDSKQEARKEKVGAIKKRLASVAVSAAVLVAVISALYPLAPLAMYSIQDVAGATGSAGTIEQYTAPASGNETPQHAGITAANVEDKNYDNRIVIPKIDVDMPINEAPLSNPEAAWDKGSWRDPRASTPAAGGNTVISAHRFRYRPPHTQTFYLLDKLEAGDTFTVYWQGKEYHYEVSGSDVVPPTAVEILNQTDKPTVTLFTCTPLFSTKNRLVVRATLTGIN